MHPDLVTMARLIALAGLIAATIEYAEILRRRGLVRAVSRQRAELEREGLRGLVRVLLTDGGASER